MLFALHIEVAHKLVGMAPSSFFQYATGLSRMRYQRGQGYRSLAERHERVGAGADSLLLRMMQKRRVPDDSFQGFTDAIPHGISALMFHGLGLLDGCASATQELLGLFDESDLRLCRMSDSDVAGFLEELGPRSALGPDYCTPLEVSGFRFPPTELTDRERDALDLALTRRAHMALSFLAAVDHEMDRWNGRPGDVERPFGHPRFGALLASTQAKPRTRLAPKDPIARLVDFVAATGHRSRTGDWPRAAPTIKDMGARAELSGIVSGEGARFVQALRSGKHPMTRAAFQKLVHSQFWTSEALRNWLDEVADHLEPYLVAAHLMTLVMPDLPAAKGHLDRGGWRDAYMGWWARHASRYPPSSAQSGGNPPPDWLFGP